ncbi:HNH endonuclease [Parablautia intestinalis]|uniref:HNH endonuclease n=1 Tax=Parablautia intestinalis TaxID=2320100 RepID=A0A3A9A7X9_9FIRM|nr:HNH endonuclease signature motif containing protein [Parablautia intestinalis]RKI87880.1 HNH endonuclease [Parablautia intestinalis]
MRRNLSERDKKEIGVQCRNCGSKKELEYHHVVPISLGGKDVNSNIVCLCYPCHQKIHYGESKHGLHSTVIKKGLDVARKKGKKLGRPATGVPKEFIKEYNKLQSGEYGSITIVQFAKLQGIAVSTFYKYVGILNRN